MLFDICHFKGRTLKNHIVFPPAVFFGWSKAGEMTAAHKEHYQAVAKGGVGLIITEATCVTPDARLSMDQLGIWSDDFIPDFAEVARSCHAEGVPVLCQIHHGGFVSAPGKPLVPSREGIPPLSAGPRKAQPKVKAAETQELAVEEIRAIEQLFIDAALRIKKAGLDGVELHGAHGFLISFFFSPTTNKRTDAYGGGSYENRARFALEIIRGIRGTCGEDFIIGIRMGSCPLAEDAVEIAKLLEEAGCDIIHVSSGATRTDQGTVPEKYIEFNYNVYTAIEIQKALSIPVIASNSVGTIEKARVLVDGELVSFAAFCRNILADYDWPKKVAMGIEPHRCLGCKVCKWHTLARDGGCPARKRAKKA